MAHSRRLLPASGLRWPHAHHHACEFTGPLAAGAQPALRAQPCQNSCFPPDHRYGNWVPARPLTAPGAAAGCSPFRTSACIRPAPERPRASELALPLSTETCWGGRRRDGTNRQTIYPRAIEWIVRSELAFLGNPVRFEGALTGGLGEGGGGAVGVAGSPPDFMNTRVNSPGSLLGGMGADYRAAAPAQTRGTVCPDCGTRPSGWAPRRQPALEESRELAGLPLARSGRRGVRFRCAPVH